MSAKILKRKGGRSRFSAIKRFSRNKEGVASVEFSIIALPFFILIFGILESAIVFFAGTALEFGMNQASRTIQTGVALQDSTDEAGFKAIICNAAVLLPDCTSKLKIDVRSFDKFTNASFEPMLDENGDIKPDTSYEIGGANATVVVRAAYEWPILSSYVNSGLGNMGNGNRLITASTAFKNEPF